MVREGGQRAEGGGGGGSERGYEREAMRGGGEADLPREVLAIGRGVGGVSADGVGVGLAVEQGPARVWQADDV